MSTRRHYGSSAGEDLGPAPAAAPEAPAPVFEAAPDGPVPFARRVQIVRGDEAIASLARKAGIGAATPIALGAGDARVSPKAVCKLEAHLKDWAAAGGRVVKAAAILLLVVFAPGGCVRMPDGRLVPWGKA